MVCDQFFATDIDNHFNEILLGCIEEQSTEQLQIALRNAENLCTLIDSSGFSLLHYVAELGNETAVKLLIKAGAKVDLQNREGQTPLMLATTKKQKDIIRLLLENDADMYVCDNHGISALLLAEISTDSSILHIFLSEIIYDCYDVEYDIEGIAQRLSKLDFPLHVAASCENRNVLKYVLAKGIPIDTIDSTFKRTALHAAVKATNVKSVRYLVNQGADVNILDVLGQSPLAMIKTYQEMVFNKTPDVFREQDILEILVNSKTDLTACTKDGFMQIYWVLTTGTYDAVKTVLLSKVDLQASDSHGRTALHYLAKNVDSGVVSALESRMFMDTQKELVERQKKLSWSEYIKLSVMTTDQKIVKEIESELVNWNARDKDGRTILHHAMAAGNVEFVRYLMKKDVDVKVKAHNGDTPFIEAIKSSTDEWRHDHRVGCTNLVVEHGADPVAEIESYFDISRTKSMINRHFAMLKPVLAALVLRLNSGENVSEKVLKAFDSHLKIKNYIYYCRKVLNETKCDESFYSKIKESFYYV